MDNKNPIGQKVEKNGKKISIVIPCYNEVENVDLMAFAVQNIMDECLSQYEYELLFIDNASTDGTRDKLRRLCAGDKRIKAILNVTNFGQFNSPFYAMCQSDGDCTITMCCDFQDPVEMIPRFVEQWEKGHRIVSGIKTSSRENPVIYFLRSMYYKLIKNMSSAQLIEHFTGFGLYDKTFISLLRKLDDPVPFVRGIVGEYGQGFNWIEVEYEQQRRRAGKTHNNFYTLYDAAMLSFTSYTKIGLRLATFVGFAASAISFIIAIVYLVYKILHWNSFQAGMAPLVIGLFFFSSLQLLFIGFMGEYVLNINTRVINRPLVVEEERLNFDQEDQTDKRLKE